MTTTWPAEVAAVCYTVAARRAQRQPTLDQWAALGADVIVVEQHPTTPHGEHGACETGRRAYQDALDTATPWILTTEDDVDVDPTLPTWWPQLLDQDRVVSLWHRPRFAPRGMCPHPTDQPPALLPMRDWRHWWGSQAMLLPRRIAAAIAGAPRIGRGGWDTHIRRTLIQLGHRPSITSPCLVEHRPLHRLSTPTPIKVDSQGCYRGPRTPERPADLVATP